MIVTRSKPFELVLKGLDGARRIFIVGCGECAAACRTGGEPEVAEMTERLTAEGFEVTGSTVIQTGCHEPDVKRSFRSHSEEVEAADVILVMSCGAGVQAAREATDKRLFPANDSVFLGNVRRIGNFEEKCSLCGDCVLGRTGGYCPVTRCHKGLMNGPCGGTNDGKCEIDPEVDCVWTLIYNQLEKEGRLDQMREYVPPKNWNPGPHPARLTVKRKKAGGE